jgi:hypothetical protein
LLLRGVALSSHTFKTLFSYNNSHASERILCSDTGIAETNGCASINNKNLVFTRKRGDMIMVFAHLAKKQALRPTPV